MVMKKSKKDNSVLFIDATNYCEKVTNNNKLRPSHIDDILKLFTDRTDIENVVKLVSNKDIEENDYNLSVSTYVEKKDTREKIDIKVLNAKIKEIVAREDVLRQAIDKIIEDIEG
jgi:type I restriction enzyme M protein